MGGGEEERKIGQEVEKRRGVGEKGRGLTDLGLREEERNRRGGWEERWGGGEKERKRG